MFFFSAWHQACTEEVAQRLCSHLDSVQDTGHCLHARGFALWLPHSLSCCTCAEIDAVQVIGLSVVKAPKLLIATFSLLAFGQAAGGVSLWAWGPRRNVVTTITLSLDPVCSFIGYLAPVVSNEWVCPLLKCPPQARLHVICMLQTALPICRCDAMLCRRSQWQACS